MSDLFDLEAAVHDEASFVEFMCALVADWEDEKKKEAKRGSSSYDSGANGWQNGSVGAFLEAASAWAGSTASRDAEDKVVNPWRRAAAILHAGKLYE